MSHTYMSWEVIKLGGSILVPDLPDAEFLRDFREILLNYTQQGRRFLIIPGGGKICRHYQEVLQKLNCPIMDQHWIGIYSGEFNAQLVRLAFGEHAFAEIHMTPDTMPAIETITESIIIGGSGTPGNSHNLGAVQFARYVGAEKVINLSNIDYVYSADPKKDPEAVPYKEVGWEQYMTFIPQVHAPGGNSPFDIIASKRAREWNIDVLFMKGSPIDHFAKYLETGEVEGTVISNRFA